MNLRKADSGIGLEIGNGAIKLVHIRTGGETPEVLLADTEPIVRGENEELGFRQKLAALRELVKRTGLRKKAVAVALNPAILTTRDIQIPRVPDEELLPVIEWEIRQLIEFSRETHNLDFIIHNRDSDFQSNKYQAMVVVSKKSDLQKTVNLIENAGLRVNRLGVPADALSNLVGRHPDVEQDMGCAIVNTGHDESSVTIVQSGKLRFSRQLDFSFFDFLKNISEQFMIPLEETHSLIRELSLQENENETAEGMKQRTLASSLMESLTAELNKSFNFYASVSRGSTVNRVYITGDLADVNGIAPFFLEHVGIITGVLHPFKGLRVQGKLPRNANQFAVAIGMGLMPW